MNTNKFQSCNDFTKLKLKAVILCVIKFCCRRQPFDLCAKQNGLEYQCAFIKEEIPTKSTYDLQLGLQT